MANTDPHYNIVGQNNRGVLVQSKRLAPFHEDLTKAQPFEPSQVQPGERTRIKLDFKHSVDRELILNDIRLQFKLDFKPATNVNKVFCVRATDLIRELTVKINEDIVFKVDKKGELTHLWLMNNHRIGGENLEVAQSSILNHGIIPFGDSPPLFYRPADKTWYFSYTPAVAAGAGGTPAAVAESWSDPATGPWSNARGRMRRSGLERHDGRPRLIYDDTSGYNYQMPFNISLNQLVGSIFTRFHMRRVEYVQIEVVFEPFLNATLTQDFLLFKKSPDATTHPYSQAKFTNLQIVQYRTTLLDGVHGFTLPPNRMLSWLMHRYSRREYNFNFSTQTSIDIQLHDWEIRTNITRLYWMLEPINILDNPTNKNGFNPFARPCEGYENLYGVELLWKNDKVLDLQTHQDVVRHYTLSENKRHALNDPHLRFARLMNAKDMAGEEVDNQIVYYGIGVDPSGSSEVFGSPSGLIGKLKYEQPIYHVDLAMNVHHGVHGGELIGGIVNDTSDYVVRIKQAVDDPAVEPATSAFQHVGARKLWVWIEYQTLVNLAAGSTQFNRGSQTITKQLNVQN